MGANFTQVFVFFVFFISFVVIGAALFLGGNALLMIVGLVLLGASIALFLKAKPLEHLEG